MGNVKPALCGWSDLGVREMDQRFTLRPGNRPILRAMIPVVVLILSMILSIILWSESFTRSVAGANALALPLMALPALAVASTELRVEGATTIILSKLGLITFTTSVGGGAKIVEGAKGWHIAHADGRLQVDLGSEWDREQMSRLARHLGLGYENIASSASTARSWPDGAEQLRLSLSPGLARLGPWSLAVFSLGSSIADCVIDKNPELLLTLLPLAAVSVAWSFYRQPRTFLVADAYSVRIYRPFLPVMQISRYQIGMVTESGKICDHAGRLLGTETPWTREQVSQLRAFLGVPLVEDDASCGG